MTARIAFAYAFNDHDWLGGKNYFASLFAALAALAPTDLQFVFLAGTRTETSLPAEFPWLEVVRTPLLDRMSPGWLVRQVTLRSGNVDPLLEKRLRSLDIDLLSHSGYLGRQRHIRTLPWLYDFQFMHLPQFWQKKHIAWAEQRYHASCRLGTGVIVSSAAALADLERFEPCCRIPCHVLRFVSNPVDLQRLPSLQAVLAQYRLPDDYFYLPNQFWMNKNHGLAIDALALLKGRGMDATIACTGKTFDGRQPGYFDRLMEQCRQAGVADRFRILGTVPHAHAQGLMAHARAVINPSRFEGWSSTVEEAKTLQRRLLLSDIAVHREQSPELGSFFAVDDAKTLADLMARCLGEPRRPLDREAIGTNYDARLRAFGSTYLGIVRRTLSGAANG